VSASTLSSSSSGPERVKKTKDGGGKKERKGELSGLFSFSHFNRAVTYLKERPGEGGSGGRGKEVEQGGALVYLFSSPSYDEQRLEGGKRNEEGRGGGGKRRSQPSSC